MGRARVGLIVVLLILAGEYFLVAMIDFALLAQINQDLLEYIRSHISPMLGLNNVAYSFFPLKEKTICNFSNTGSLII